MPRSSALRGLTVLDLSQYVAGPYCTKLLADYGAEVLKIERPELGDGCRRLGPFRDDDSGSESGGLFAYLNAGKLGATLNLRSTAGADVFRRLVRDTDVVVESFRPGTMDSFGLSYEALASINPRVIHCSITSYGQSGPYRDYAASELVIQAMGGLTHLTGERSREPLFLPLPIAQYVAGTQAFIAVLAAERVAKLTGEGEHVDVSIFEALISVQDTILATEQYSGHEQQRDGYRHPVSYPGSSFECRDGYVFAFSVGPENWLALLDVIGRPDIAADPRFQTNAARMANADELDVALGAWFAEHTASEIYHRMQRRRVPFAIVATAKDLLESAHLQSRGYFDTLDLDGSSLAVPGPPFRLQRASPAEAGIAPLLGQHNEDVFAGRLGFSQAELAAFRSAGVI